MVVANLLAWRRTAVLLFSFWQKNGGASRAAASNSNTSRWR